MPKRLPKSDTLVFRVCELFLDGHKPGEIAKKVNKEEGGKISLNRESIYPLLVEGRKRGFFKLVPPLESSLTKKLAVRFHLDPLSIKVVNAHSESVSQHLAETGAELALSLIRELGQRGRNPVHIGLGPGRVSRLVARQLGEAMRSASDVPQLALHAITAGCPSRSAEYSPLAFFSFFDRSVVDGAHGFFSDAVVPCSRYGHIKKRQGFADAMEQRDDIDIVFTALGDMTDEHDLFRVLLEKSSPDAIAYLQKQGWVGNVQYRPYSSESAIEDEPNSVRVVTLFELEDLRRWACTRGKHVILLVHPCGMCGMRRTKALRPLLEVPELKVWSRLVIDATTAREVLLPQAEGS